MSLLPEFKSTAMAQLVDSIIQRENYLLNQGIPPREAHRVVIDEFSRLLNVKQDDWGPDAEVGGKTNPSGELTDKIFSSKYPPVLPFPVFVDTQAWGNDGFDHRNPDPPEVDPNVIIKDESYYRQPGYAGGRDVENLSQYKTNAPENIVLKSEPNPYQNQNAENYVDAPFEPPSNPSMHGEYGFNVQKSIPEWRYDVEQDQGGIDERFYELIIERDKKTGRWVKHGMTKGENNTDRSLAPILDHARARYLHGDQEGKIEMPHMVVAPPEMPEEPHMVVDDKLEEATKYVYQHRDISLDDIPGDTPEQKKTLKRTRLELLAPWLLLLGGAAGAGYFLSQPEGKMQLLAKFTYHGHEYPEICQGYDGRTFDLLDKNNRPVPPSEGLGYTNTHPNCKCTWEFEKKIAPKKDKLKKGEKKHIKGVNREINKASKKGELHKVEKDGHLSKKTYKTNFRKIQEAITEIRDEFDWLSPDYIDRIKNVDAPGQMFLVRASSEAITDHRSEGEPYRRWLQNDELHAMARTAIGHGMDVNHRQDLRTNAQVLDSEYNKGRHEIQMIINEQDPEILKAISKGDITAVSINGGAPRSERVDCDTGECFIVPEGVVLGELDDVALTWVVTNPQGMMYRNQWIKPAEPGVKVTAIEPL